MCYMLGPGGNGAPIIQGPASSPEMISSYLRVAEVGGATVASSFYSCSVDWLADFNLFELTFLTKCCLCWWSMIRNGDENLHPLSSVL